LDGDVTSPPEELPTYRWASRAPAEVGIGDEGWREGLRAVTPGKDYEELPDAPTVIEEDLVPIADPRIRVMGAYFHEGWPHAVAGAWLRPAAMDRLVLAVEALPAGFGLAVWDAWRDPRLQAALHDRVYRDTGLAPGFVAYPDPDPRRCPPHASGGTVDLTLTYHQEPLSLGTGFDAFVPEAAASALEAGGPAVERDLRRLLSRVMSTGGFVQHPQEWWHWEYGTRYWSAVTGRPVLFGHARLPREVAEPQE
jgi:D-alanyl-D-alanine dipeptidase